MNLGEINKGVVALLAVLILGAGGYLWYTMMYKPAVEAKTTADAAAQQAESGLAAARSELEQAQQRLEEAKSELAKPDDSVARLAKALTAVPTKDLVDDATIVLVELAERSGVQTRFETGNADGNATNFDSGGGGALQGAKPIDLEFEAAGTYAEMMQFMSLVHSSVEEKDSKLYTRGRLFNVVKLEIGTEDERESGGFGDEAGNDDADAFVLGPNDIEFTVVVRIYSSSTENAQSVGVATPDAAAAPTDPNAIGGGAGDPAAGGAGTTPGGASTDPSVAGGGTAGTAPADGTAPAGTGTGDAAGAAPAATAGGI